MCWGPEKARKGHQIPLELELGTSGILNWELNLGLLKENPVLLTFELFLHPFVYFNAWIMSIKQTLKLERPGS